MGRRFPFSLTFRGFLVVCLYLKEAEPCKTGWTFYKGHCYGLFNNKLNWAEAENECHRLGAHLASIHFMEEMVHVSQYIRRFLIGSKNVWIGLSLRNHNQRWEWVDHTSVRYLPWDDGEPNNFMWRENCVELLGKKDYIRWNDQSCSKVQSFLCKNMAL